MLSRAKRFRYRLEWLAVMLGVKLVPLMSRRGCYEFGGMLGALAASIDRKGFRVAVANLEAAFGDRYNDRERATIARESYQHFARTMLDLFWSPRLTRENFTKYVDVTTLDEVTAAAKAENPELSAIVACYHYSNFEWLSLASGFRGLNAAIIAQRFKNPLLDPIFKRLREQSGHETIPQERAVVRFLRALKRKGRVAMLVDLTVSPSEGAVAIDCFGLKTSVTLAHAWLHEKTGAPLVPAHCEPLPGGKYRLVFHPILTAPPGATHQQVAQMCWDSLEPYVRENPAPWLWMYKHWRYKPADADRAYPFYANPHRKFDKVIRKSALAGAEDRQSSL